MRHTTGGRRGRAGPALLHRGGARDAVSRALYGASDEEGVDAAADGHAALLPLWEEAVGDVHHDAAGMLPNTGRRRGANVSPATDAATGGDCEDDRDDGNDDDNDDDTECAQILAEFGTFVQRDVSARSASTPRKKAALAAPRGDGDGGSDTVARAPPPFTGDAHSRVGRDACGMVAWEVWRPCSLPALSELEVSNWGRVRVWRTRVPVAVRASGALAWREHVYRLRSVVAHTFLGHLACNAAIISLNGDECDARVYNLAVARGTHLETWAPLDVSVTHMSACRLRVSTLGRVMDANTHACLPCVDVCGVLCVKVADEGGDPLPPQAVAPMIARAFLPPPPRADTIPFGHACVLRHVNGDATDLRACNLEWTVRGAPLAPPPPTLLPLRHVPQWFPPPPPLHAAAAAAAAAAVGAPVQAVAAQTELLVYMHAAAGRRVPEAMLNVVVGFTPPQCALVHALLRRGHVVPLDSDEGLVQLTHVAALDTPRLEYAAFLLQDGESSVADALREAATALTEHVQAFRTLAKVMLPLRPSSPASAAPAPQTHDA